MYCLHMARNMNYSKMVKSVLCCNLGLLWNIFKSMNCIRGHLHGFFNLDKKPNRDFEAVLKLLCGIEELYASAER